jgi:hypothetical protein
MTEEIVDQGTLREQLLRTAVAARTMDSAGARRRAVSGILRLSFSPQMVGIPRDVRAEPALSETELFEEVYADHGAKYWQAVIDDRELGDDSLAGLLALHLAADLFARWDHRLALSEVSKREKCKAALDQNQAGDTRARLTELNRNPNTQHLVSESLRRFLSPPAIVAARAADKKAFGRPVAADWSEIKKALKVEIEAVGFPRKKGAPEWRSQADVIRFIEKLTGDDEPGKTALKENAKKMLAEISAEMAGKSESTSRP